jgi:hypothetical protein
MIKKLLTLIVLSTLIFSTSAGLSTATQTNHGQVVSNVAKSTEPGPDHGPIVSEAARNKSNNNYALNLDGSDDYVDLPTLGISAPNQPFTIETWVKSDSSQRQVIFQNGSGSVADSGKYSVSLFIETDGKLWGFVNNAQEEDVRAYGNTTLNPNTWYHVVMTYDGTGEQPQAVKLYLNGALDSGTNEFVSIRGRILMANPTDDWVIGAGSGSVKGIVSFNGSMDDARIWNKALTQDEIQSNMYREIQPQDGLVGYWKFDEGSGEIAKDSSGNGNDGTLVNGPTWTTDTPF